MLFRSNYAFRRPGSRILDGDAKLIIPVEGSGESKVTLPVLMKRAGYRTAAIGKWHLGLGSGEGEIDWNSEIKPSPPVASTVKILTLPSTTVETTVKILTLPSTAVRGASSAPCALAPDLV